MNLFCDWQTKRAKWRHLARSGLPAVSRKINLFFISCNRSFIDQACSVKMAEYWPGSFFCVFTNTQKNNLGLEIRKQLRIAGGRWWKQTRNDSTHGREVQKKWKRIRDTCCETARDISARLQNKEQELDQPRQLERYSVKKGNS